jgi:hypothetical protein
MRNRRKKKNTTSQFVGVNLYKPSRRWDSRITHQGKRIKLGRFDSEIEAAKAYDEAAKKYFGEFARLNFPEESEESRALFTRIGKRWARLKRSLAKTVARRSWLVSRTSHETRVTRYEARNEQRNR